MKVMSISGVNRMRKAESGRYCITKPSISTCQLRSETTSRLTFFRGGLLMCTPSSPRAFRSCSILLRLTNIIGFEQIVGGGILPSPTSDLSVSGMNLITDQHCTTSHPPQSLNRAKTHKINGINTTPTAMARNQKIDLQPRVSAKTPPKSGPKHGPMRAPSWKNPIYLPRSLGSETSATHPAPIAITAEPPVA